MNSNLFVNKSVVNNSSVLKSNKIQNEYGTFTNDGELSTDHLINKSRFDNSSTSDNNIITNIDNEQNSLFQNSGKLKVSSNFVNKGGFKNNSGTVTVSNLINEETGTIANDAGLHVESTLINRYHFVSLSNSNISVQSLINEISGSFRNSGHVSSLNLTNKGGIGNEGTISANILHNELNSVFENKGNLNVNVEFLNRGTFSNIGIISTINLNNELNSTFENKNNLTVTDKLTNKNSFINYLSGTVTTKYLENYNNYKNSGNINVTNDFVNNSNVELKETSVVNVSGGFENKNGALVSNKGSITTQSLVNRGRFENMDNSFLTVTNITNHHLSDFINRGRVSVLNNFVNNGNLSLTSDSRLSINGVYRQNGGVVNLTLNGYTTDSLIKASQMFIKNNTVLKLSTDPGFNLGVTQYVLIESDTEISFNDFGAFKGDIDGTGLGMVRWSVSLSSDKKKLLLNIENVSPPLSPFPPNSVLTEEEKHLIDILSRFDTTKLKHPYLKSLVKKFQSSLISEYEKKLLAQSLTYTPSNASVRVVRDNYSVIIKKILSSLNMRTTGKYDESGISTNYLASTTDNKYFMIKDLYSLQNDFASVNYISDSRGTDLFNESVDSFDEGSTNSESKKQKLIGLRAWADGVYSIGRYGKHGIYDEFKTNISGFVAGVDKEFLDKYTVGLSLSTSNSEAEETSFSINTMNVNLSIYSMTKFTRAYFTNILSYGFFKHNQGRSKVGDLLEARYNTYGVSFYTEYKYLLTAHIDMKGFTRFGLNKQSDIREITKSGIGGLERNVDSIAYNDLILGYGMEYNNRIFKSGKMALIPFASFDYEYNFSHKPLNVASYFADMGPDYKFVTKTDKSNLHKFALGMGISFARSDVVNPLITKFIYSFDASSAGFANALSLKFIKSF